MVNLTVKMLSGETFPITVEGPQTVGSVKEQIHSLKAFPLDGMKLIHAGNVLTDDRTVDSVGVKEGDFLVCVVRKAATTNKPVAPPTPAPVPVPVPVPTTTPTTTTVPTPGTVPTPTPTTTTGGAPVTAEVDEAVSNIVSMGFPEDQVRLALRAAFGNAERAVEYLMTGIPDSVLASMGGGAPTTTTSGRTGPPPTTTTPTETTPTPTTGTTTGTTPTSGPAADALNLLRNHPQLNQLKALVQSNPSQLPLVLDQIGRSSPALLSVITSNRDAFVSLLMEPIAPTGTSGTGTTTTGGGTQSLGGGLPGMPGRGMDPRMLAALITAMPEEQRAALAGQMGVTVDQLGQVAQMMASGMIPMGEDGDEEGEGGAEGVPPGATVVRLTEAEAAAVERLVSLGFTRNQAIEAYLACDKNEQLAANFLLENSFS